MRALYLAATIFCLSAASAPAQAAHRHQSTTQMSMSAWIMSGREASAAYWRQHRHRHWQRWSYHLRRHYARVHNPRTGRGIRHVDFSYHTVWSKKSTLPAPCRVAASMGGPCGCWAAHILLGRLDHVWRGINLWRADDWLRFPRAAPAPGTAAVWPHRHVAPVLAVHNDGTVTVRDSWAVHRVRVAGLVFVQPPSMTRRETVRWPSVVPL